MKYNFDLISDIHIDFYIDIRKSEEKMRKKIEEFTKSILPEKINSPLIIAGDLGHYNRQNIFFLEELKKYYENIILVNGNHDYYMVSNNVRKKYNNDSKKRAFEMKKEAEKIKGIHYLDGDIIELNGIKFGGVGMWYDFSYGKQVFGMTQESLFSQWKKVMSDYKYIKGLQFYDDFREADKEKEKLDKIIDESDVIITHVGPEWSRIPNKYKIDVDTSFYYFDGKPYFDRIENKLWLWGHTHERYDYNMYGCRFINASLGYPSEKNNRKIINVIDTNPWLI